MDYHCLFQYLRSHTLFFIHRKDESFLHCEKVRTSVLPSFGVTFPYFENVDFLNTFFSSRREWGTAEILMHALYGKIFLQHFNQYQTTAIAYYRGWNFKSTHFLHPLVKRNTIPKALNKEINKIV